MQLRTITWKTRVILFYFALVWYLWIVQQAMTALTDWYKIFIRSKLHSHFLWRENVLCLLYKTSSWYKAMLVSVIDLCCEWFQSKIYVILTHLWLFPRFALARIYPFFMFFMHDFVWHIKRACRILALVVARINMPHKNDVWEIQMLYFIWFEVYVHFKTCTCTTRYFWHDAIISYQRGNVINYKPLSHHK